MARNVGLHVRHPDGWDGREPFIQKLRSTFDAYQSGITFSVASTVPVAGTLDRIDVGGCADAPSAAAAAAFTSLAPAGMDDDHVVVLFVSELIGAQWGCAQCPVGARGVMVLCGAAPITLAHEIAHLFLGPSHDGSILNLMFGDTSAIMRDPPLLLPSQMDMLRRAEWQLPAVGQLEFVELPMKRARPVRKRRKPKRRARKRTKTARTTRKTSRQKPVRRTKHRKRKRAKR